MRSLGKGSLSATTKVKVLSPEIILFALGHGFHFPEANSETHVKGECGFVMPGSESVAGKRTVHIGTWESRNVPTEASKRAEEVMRKYAVPVVGPIHSRGVNRVMPVESISGALEGVGGLMQRNCVRHAIH